MRYYIRCKLNSWKKHKFAESIKFGFLAKDKIFYEGMQSALRGATVDKDGIVHFVEVCYCLEGGLFPMAMEIPVLEEYAEDIEVKDARLRDQCTMECEFCDCTRNIKLPGSPLTDYLNMKESPGYLDNFIDIGRIKLNRKKQKEGVEELKKLNKQIQYNKIKPVFAGAAVSGLFAIFYDGSDYFRIKNIQDNKEARNLLKETGFEIYGTVSSMKQSANNSLAKSDKRSNVV